METKAEKESYFKLLNGDGMETKTKKERYFKILNADGTTYTREFQWPIPNGKSCDWLPPIKGRLALCRNAYHVLTLSQLLEWGPEGPLLVEVEIRNKSVTDGKKIGVRNVRPLRIIEQWNETTLRLFEADCAERVLPLFEKTHPDDFRPRKAIQAARGFALGQIDMDVLKTAWQAAEFSWFKTEDVAWYATWAAMRAAGKVIWNFSGEDAAKNARNAVRIIGRGTVSRDAAWKAEWQWQLQRLSFYLNT